MIWYNVLIGLNYFVIIVVNLVLNFFNKDKVFDGDVGIGWGILEVIINLKGMFIVNVFIIYIISMY